MAKDGIPSDANDLTTEMSNAIKEDCTKVCQDMCFTPTADRPAVSAFLVYDIDNTKPMPCLRLNESASSMQHTMVRVEECLAFGEVCFEHATKVLRPHFTTLSGAMDEPPSTNAWKIACEMETFLLLTSL